jgi:hypothetical protein
VIAVYGPLLQCAHSQTCILSSSFKGLTLGFPFTQCPARYQSTNPQHHFTGSPAGVALAEFLDRDGFLPDLRVIGGIARPEDVVIDVEEDTAHPNQLRGTALSQENFIVHEHIRVGQCATASAAVGKRRKRQAIVPA